MIKRTIFPLAFALGLCFFSACSKDKDKTEIKETDKAIQKTNVKISDAILKHIDNVQENGSHLWYFSLDAEKEIPYQEAASNLWDFSYDPTTDAITVNNRVLSEVNQQFGIVGKGDASITVVPKSFTEVTLAPADEYFNAQLDAQGNIRNARKKYSYNADDGNIILGWWSNQSTGSSKERLTQTLENRTFVFITNKGKYAKVQIQSVFKNSPKVPTDLKDKYYLTFRYFVQKDGSKNLDSSIK